MKSKFCELATHTANLSSHYQYRHGAVIAHKNRVISLGTNSLKTHAKAPGPYSTLHAEVKAILSSRLTDFRHYDLYVARILKDGTISNSKPCQHCQGMLESLKFRNVFYSDNDGWKKL